MANPIHSRVFINTNIPSNLLFVSGEIDIIEFSSQCLGTTYAFSFYILSVQNLVFAYCVNIYVMFLVFAY